MKVMMLAMLSLLVSCGRDNDSGNECRTKEHMIVRCQAENIPTYGRPYAVEMCNRSYELNRCY